jgi:hypothetical protein
MSAPGEERDELSRLSATELAQAYVKSVEAEEATELSEDRTGSRAIAGTSWKS